MLTLLVRQVTSAYVRMMHGKQKYNHHVLCRFELTEMSGRSLLMGLLTRKGAYWSFRALGIPASGRSIADLLEVGNSESGSLSQGFCRFQRIWLVCRKCRRSPRPFDTSLSRSAEGQAWQPRIPQCLEECERLILTLQ